MQKGGEEGLDAAKAAIELDAGATEGGRVCKLGNELLPERKQGFFFHPCLLRGKACKQESMGTKRHLWDATELLECSQELLTEI